MFDIKKRVINKWIADDEYNDIVLLLTANKDNKEAGLFLAGPFCGGFAAVFGVILRRVFCGRGAEGGGIAAKTRNAKKKKAANDDDGAK